jgi:hypothetical protein
VILKYCLVTLKELFLKFVILKHNLVTMKAFFNTICEFKISLGDFGKNFQLINDSAQAMKECYGREICKYQQ